MDDPHKWTPQRWAKVWAFRLERFSDHEQCHQMFQGSANAVADQLVAVMPPALFSAVMERARAATTAELKALAFQLENWAESASVAS